MRILSQDSGKYDLQYENVVLEKMTDCNTIYAYTGTGQPFKMAVYYSAERMDKAMDMLREEYVGIPNIRRMDDLYGRFKHTGKKDFELFIEHMVLKKDYFQFPSDDEVEV